MTKVKICGITNSEDALLSAKFGADALGFNFYAKSPRYIEPEKAREIAEQLPPEVLKIGVFVNESPEKVCEIAEIAGLNAIQLHGEESPEFVREIKARTNLEIIKAFRVSPEFKPEDVLQYKLDAILLDAYSPQEHGGTGETFDWKIARKVQEIFPKMYLAGGLSQENIFYALRETKPYAVDACSCLEEEKGRKNRINLINFITKIREFEWWSGISDDRNITNIYDYLKLIHLLPGMYMGSKSLTVLSVFLIGFGQGLELVPNNFKWHNFQTGEFHDFIKKKLGKTDYSGLNGFNIKLYECSEEEAFDHFFALLEEFKLEKEDLSNE
jgi:phosphoribosylanthranilate isomerase